MNLNIGKNTGNYTYRSKQPSISFKGINVQEINVANAPNQLEEVAAKLSEQKKFHLPYYHLKSAPYMAWYKEKNIPITILENPHFDVYSEEVMLLNNNSRLSTDWLSTNMARKGLKTDIENYQKPIYRVITLTDKDRDALISCYNTARGAFHRFVNSNVQDGISKTLLHYNLSGEKDILRFLKALHTQFKDKSFFNSFIAKRLSM